MELDCIEQLSMAVKSVKDKLWTISIDWNICTAYNSASRQTIDKMCRKCALKSSFAETVT